MSDQIILNSVGSYLEGDFIGPLGQNGLPLLGEATVHILDRSEEWDANLSKEDSEVILDRLDEIAGEFFSPSKQAAFFNSAETLVAARKGAKPKTYAPLDPKCAHYLLKSLECPIVSINTELEQSSKGESYFNAHYVLNAVQEARRKLDSIEEAAKQHQANGYC